MRIKSVTVYGIRSPLIEPFVISYGTYPDIPAVITIIETENGQVGYGEGVPDQCVTGETVESTYAVLKNELAPEVIGLTPFQIEEAHKRFNLKILGSPSAKAALDLAMYDLMGKLTGQPVYNLLGGKVYNNLIVPGEVSIKEPKAMASDARRLVNAGFRSIKIKVGSDSWQKDVERIKYVRKAIGNTQMRADVNQGWKDRATSLQAMEQIKDCCLDSLEQPVKADDIEALAEVKKATTIRIMVDEGVGNIRDLLKVIKLRAADVVNIKLMKAGGLYPALAIAYTAEAAGLTCLVGSMVETSIGTAAGAHLAISRSVIRSNDLVGPSMFSREVGGKIDIQGDVLTLPNRPGFGLDVDNKVIEDLSFVKDTIS